MKTTTNTNYLRSRLDHVWAMIDQILYDISNGDGCEEDLLEELAKMESEQTSLRAEIEQAERLAARPAMSREDLIQDSTDWEYLAYGHDSGRAVAIEARDTGWITPQQLVMNQHNNNQ